MQGENLGDVDRLRLGPDRLKRTSDLAGSIRLHIPEIDVTRSAEIEDHDATLRVVAFDISLLLGGEILGHREPDGTESANREKVPPRSFFATKWAGAFRKKIKHGESGVNVCAATVAKSRKPVL